MDSASDLPLHRSASLVQSMKPLTKVCLALLFSLPMVSCSTVNLVRWGTDESSVYYEPTGEFSRGMLKPFVTVIGFPVTLAWDVGTFPFQLLFGVYPYGDSFMDPEMVDVDV